MLPYWRGALFAKSACFKKIADDIKKTHENHLQINQLMLLIFDAKMKGLKCKKKGFRIIPVAT